jgi:hypothetical protein
MYPLVGVYRAGAFLALRSLPPYPYTPTPTPLPSHCHPPPHPPTPHTQEKQADALRDKLAVRMEAPGAGPREWRCLAWCIRQLGYSEKGARGLMELTRHYKHALGEPLVSAGLSVSRVGGGPENPVARASQARTPYPTALHDV